MSKLDDRLQQIEARCDAATPGPWVLFHRAGITEVQTIGDCPIAGWQGFDNGHRAVGKHKDNGEFIAHAREDIPALLEEIARLRAELARLDWVSVNERLPDTTREVEVTWGVQGWYSIGSDWYTSSSGWAVHYPPFTSVVAWREVQEPYVPQETMP